jgi:hypothetical protein
MALSEDAAVKQSVLGSALLLGLALAPPARAGLLTETVAFPSAASTVVGSLGFIDGDSIGFFWSVARGDRVTQAFTGTGLASVDRLDLDLFVDSNNLAVGQSVNWDVFLNGILVGNWSRTQAEGVGPESLSYTFPPIAGAGDYTINMVVTNQVPPGGGSISIRYPGSATFFAPAGGAVPEPSSLALLGLGALGLMVHVRRRCKRA